MEDPAELDITTRILQANNGSSKMLIEGDLIVSNTRNAINCRNKKCLWRKTNGTVKVPYTINKTFTDRAKGIILNAMKTYKRRTCIRFVLRSRQKEYISIKAIDGCYSYVGRIGGAQELSLTLGCVHHGTIQHELNHALGFYHEHSRSDRDNHVRITLENVQEGMENNFLEEDTNNLNTTYDYTSVMHYSRDAFSKNGNDTITPIPDKHKPIGQSNRMSKLDILKINKLYGCPKL
ncbi:hypothetical protein SKAU_G00372680 [Synaphobranchus kaupii]|uniref:Metalloendopeptidase n=1 Tax=Synaphobranchus kaupii TaxID=118154 RepID=A0A9Q1EGI3_SYNKA|nr:hypothetical protein SKAU_G00372680 [Synaphobranchus kaupii]